MPSNFQRVTAALVTAALFTGGAWFASGFGTDVSATQSPGLTVTLHGARNDAGNFMVMVFDQENAFYEMDYKNVAGYAELPASTGSQKVEFPDLRNGYFAIVAIHDEDADYDFAYQADGTPIEGYAVSGMNSLYEDPVFEYSLVEPGQRIDLGFFYW